MGLTACCDVVLAEGGGTILKTKTKILLAVIAVAVVSFLVAWQSEWLPFSQGNNQVTAEETENNYNETLRAESGQLIFSADATKNRQWKITQSDDNLLKLQSNNFDNDKKIQQITLCSTLQYGTETINLSLIDINSNKTIKQEKYRVAVSENGDIQIFQDTTNTQLK